MPIRLLPALALLVLIACNNSDQQNPGEKKEETMKPTITEKKYGDVEQQAVTQYTLTNANGMSVSFINYGGIITDIITPDSKGKKGNVVLGYESLNGFLQKDNPYFNALIGRYGNRIGKAEFTLDGKTYQLAKNNNGNTLHGGLKGFDKVIWKATKLAGDTAVQLDYTSKDGEEGYPGNLNVTVVYSLTAANELKIDYTATTDQATPVNLTSHCYFNLSGGHDSTIMNHDLQIDADKYTEVDDKLIPTGKLIDVNGGAMDFRKAKPVGRDMAQVNGGYDHNWVLNKKAGELSRVAVLHDSASGRTMEVWTTEPGLQFYSGNFLNGALADTRDGRRYGRHAALCLETQHFPDSPNQPSFPSTILKPGETYRQTTIYKF